MPGLNGLPPGLARNGKRPQGNPHVKAYEAQQALDAANAKIEEKDNQIADLTNELNENKSELTTQTLVLSLLQGILEAITQKLSEKEEAPVEEVPANDAAADAPNSDIISLLQGLLESISQKVAPADDTAVDAPAAEGISADDAAVDAPAAEEIPADNTAVDAPAAEEISADDTAVDAPKAEGTSTPTIESAIMEIPVDLVA